jgi:hypothetical protein
MATNVRISVESPLGDVTVVQETHWTVVGQDPMVDIDALLETSMAQVLAAYSVKRAIRPPVVAL